MILELGPDNGDLEISQDNG